MRMNSGTGRNRVQRKPIIEEESPTDKTDNQYDLACRERFLFVLQNLVGQNVEVQMLDGTVYEGLFYTSTLYGSEDIRVVLKTAQEKTPAVIQDGKKPSVSKEDLEGATLILEYVDVLQIIARKMDAKKPPAAEKKACLSEFKTDTDISSKAHHIREHILEEVDHSWLASSPNQFEISEQGLDWDAGAGACIAPTLTNGLDSEEAAHWDQFEANKRLFNVSSNFDENLYTIPLDKTKMSNEQIARAERLAREIEGQKSSNIHLAEERGQRLEAEHTEEELYGGVMQAESLRRKKEQGIYIPPALRQRESSSSPDDYVSWRKQREPVDSWEAESRTEQVKEPSTKNTKATTEKLDRPKNKEAPQTGSGPSVEDKEVVQKILVELERKSLQQHQQVGGRRASLAKPALNPNAKTFSLNSKAKDVGSAFPNYNINPAMAALVANAASSMRQSAPAWVPGVGPVPTAPSYSTTGQPQMNNYLQQMAATAYAARGLQVGGMTAQQTAFLAQQATAGAAGFYGAASIPVPMNQLQVAQNLLQAQAMQNFLAANAAAMGAAQVGVGPAFMPTTSLQPPTNTGPVTIHPATLALMAQRRQYLLDLQKQQGAESAPIPMPITHQGTYQNEYSDYQEYEGQEDIDDSEMCMEQEDEYVEGSGYEGDERGY